MSSAFQLTRSDVVARAKALRDIDTFVPIAQIAFHWLQIVGALAAFYFYQSWWLYVPLILFISARQYGLAILLHDAQHTLLHRNKSVNKWITIWLVSAPIGAEFVSSQQSHLDHHFHLGSKESDPDYALYCFGEPSAKQTSWQIAKYFIARIVGGKVASILRRTAVPSKSSQAHHESALFSLLKRGLASASTMWPVIVVQTAFLVVLTLMFGWYGYFALWFLPLVTLASFYDDFRIFCEHSLAGREAHHTEERLVSFVSNPLERFFIAPNHMNYHAEHHLFPYVPHTNLPALRKFIQACPELNDRVEWRSGYLTYLFANIAACKELRGSKDEEKLGSWIEETELSPPLAPQSSDQPFVPQAAAQQTGPAST